MRGLVPSLTHCLSVKDQTSLGYCLEPTPKLFFTLTLMNTHEFNIGLEFGQQRVQIQANTHEQAKQIVRGMFPDATYYDYLGTK